MSLAPCTTRGSDGLESRVRRAIGSRLASGHLLKRDVAEELDLSLRTLDRELARRGTCFRELLEGLRSEIARRELLASRSTLRELALRLGYADPANFTRAFRRWTGESPRSFRDRADAR